MRLHTVLMVISIVLLSALPAYSQDFEGTIHLDAEELTQYATFLRAPDRDKPATAARMLQLQLMAAGCKSSVLPLSTNIGPEGVDIKVTSPNCKVLELAGRDCPPGYSARFLPEAEVRERFLLGKTKYKLCIQSQNSHAPSTSSRIRDK